MKTIYRCGIEFDIFYIFLIIFFIIFFVKYRKHRNYSSLFSVLIIGIVNILVFVVAAFYTVFPLYCLTVGKYNTVEGYVEDFVPMPPSGHPYESFSINDICFQYSDYLITMGYRKARYFGGVIKGNGQYLRIYYIPSDNNYIIKIEEKD